MDECFICLNNLKNGSSISRCTHCQKEMHTKCIKKWFKNNKKKDRLCPWCQKKSEIKKITCCCCIM